MMAIVLLHLILLLTFVQTIPKHIEASSPDLSVTGKVYFEHDGLHPIRGKEGDTFFFAIHYKDNDGDPPVNGYPRLLIDMNHDKDFDDRDDLNMTMEHMKIGPYNYSMGTDFSREWVIDEPGTYTYAFFVLNQVNETDLIGPFDGPVVQKDTSEGATGPDIDLTIPTAILVILICSIASFIIGLKKGRGRKR